MTDLPKILQSKVKIRFQDCDPFNHLNNGRYLDYFINAREDHLLENYQLDIYAIAREKGLAWVSSNSQMAYIRPVFTSEEVLIESQLIQFSTKHVQVEARMLHLKDLQVKAFCWMGFVHFNLVNSTPILHSENYMTLFSQVCLPVSESTFNERELFFRKQVKLQSSSL